MSSGSMRDTFKVLNTAFSSPTVPYPLPVELRETIESFLDRYDHIDDHDSQRFHDDLHALYQRCVTPSPEKHGAFLAILRLARPAILGEAHLTIWWNLLLQNTINGTGHKRHEFEDAREFILSILVYDPDLDKDGEHARLSTVFTKKVLEAYLARTSLPSSTGGSTSPESEVVARELEYILVTFGRKMPKLLLLALNDLFVQKQYRIQALNLLSAFVRLQPPHLHLVLETPLIQHLEKCLLIDASSTVIELALVVLIMFLPHICGALTSDHHLAKMFLVYSRVLCWDKLGTVEEAKPTDEDADDDSDEESQLEDGDSEPGWEAVQHSTEYPDPSPPTLMHYFTFLYGLFPLNFMSFVRKPRKYLKSLSFPHARDFDLDQDLIHSRTEPYRRVHLLHPNMFSTTAEEELSDNRWIRSDPADVVTDCMDLCVAVNAALEDPGPPPNAALPALPSPPVPDAPTQLSLDDIKSPPTESNASWSNTQSTTFAPAEEAPDPSETSETLPKSKSVMSLQSLNSIASPLLKAHDVSESPNLPLTTDVKKSNFHIAVSTKVVAQQPSQDSFAHKMTGSMSPTHADFQGQTIASLQREIMLLRNDLNFERYLKLQHLSHIGHLQRKHIREATAEAETQNLINNNKTLKARLVKANELYAQLKKETLTSRNQSKKWETDLSAKVRSYRDSEKIWHNEEDSLRYELKRTQSDYDHLKQIVEKAEAEQLKAQQRTKALEYELEDYANVRRELDAAQEKIFALEDQRKEQRLLLQERNDLRNKLEIANIRLNSRELERERSIKAYERRIMELETRSQAAEKDTGRPGQLPASVQQMLDSALAASNAKLQQLKKTHYHLLEQHTELQMKYHDLEGERQAEQGRFQFYSQFQESPQAETDKSRMSRNPSTSFRPSTNHNSSRFPPLSSTSSPQEDRDQLFDHHSTSSNTSPIVHPARPVSNPKPQRPSPYPGFGGSFVPDLLATYDASPSPQSQSQRQSNAPPSSSQSSHSVDTEGNSKKDKVVPTSEVRVYGRGGAQNIGKKVKDKDKDKDQKKPGSTKTGGFRGLRGIM